MVKRKVCISLDECFYNELVYQARDKWFGTGKNATSAYAHFLLVNALKRGSSQKEELPKKTGSGCVYIIHAGRNGYIKIGYTGSLDISRRMKPIQGSCPEKIKILRVIPNCTYQDEHYLHMKYRAFDVRGEWYENSILSLIDGDIKSIGSRSTDCQNLPTSSDHYLYLMET